MRIEYRQVAPARLEVLQKDTGEELKGWFPSIWGPIWNSAKQLP